MKIIRFKLLTLLVYTIWIFTSKYVYSQERNNVRTSISGYIPSYQDSIADVSVVLISDSGSNGLRSEYRYSQALKNGHFSFDIPINEVKSIILQLNSQNLLTAKGEFKSHRIFLTAGDSIYCYVNDYGINNIQYSGKGHEKIDLIRKLHNWTTSPERPRSIFDEPRTNRAKYTFERIDSLGLIIDDYKGTIDEHSLNMIWSYHVSATLELILRAIAYLDPLDRDTKQAYSIVLENWSVFDNLMQLTPKEALQIHNLDLNFHDLAYFSLALQEGKPREGKPDPIKMYKYLSEMYHDKPIKNYLLYSFLYRYIRKYDFTDGVDECIVDFLSQVPADGLQYTRLNNSTYHQYLKGKPAMNFVLADTSGNMHSLNDFKGKVVVIDFWFTGCIGCIQTAKLLHEIEEKYKNRDVVFISINIDKTTEKWKYGIGNASSISSLQLYTNGQGNEHPIIKENKIYSYPTLTIIDKAGHYIYNKAPDPRVELTSFLNAIDRAL